MHSRTGSPFAISFPAAAPEGAHWTDTVITEGHVSYCAEHGHASWSVDGVPSPRCPRCGVIKGEVSATPEPVAAMPTWEDELIPEPANEADIAREHVAAREGHNRAMARAARMGANFQGWAPVSAAPVTGAFPDASTVIAFGRPGLAGTGAFASQYARTVEWHAGRPIGSAL